MTYIISPANADDAELIVDYLNAVAGETDFLTFGEGEFSYTIEEEKKYIEDLQRNRKGVMLVAKVGDKIVSSGLCVSKEGRSSHVFDLSITVLKEFWGKGIGTALIKQMENEAINLGAEKITLSVCSANERAFELYKKLGYIEEGVLKRDNKVGDKYFDTIAMGKIIDKN